MKVPHGRFDRVLLHSGGKISSRIAKQWFSV